METRLRKIRLSERERELIALLAQGHTDVTAAECLGISPRSVTNILRSLMDRLGVDNRFQLGLALGFLREAHAPAARADRGGGSS
jgi:DNA-binding CsgD family transcriptional regulator